MQSYAKSTYDYWFSNTEKILHIQDLNKGMSVTNNIEAILEKIENDEGIDLKDYIIIYRDSEGIWDGVHYYGKGKNVDFYFISENEVKDALNKLIKRLN